MINSAITISDIHLEWDLGLQDFSKVVPEKIADAIFLNGDIAGGKHALPFIEYLLGLDYKVFYVLGNHEFYGENFTGLIDFWKSVDMNNFYFLHQNTFEFDNVRIIGAPLWASLGTLEVHPFLGITKKDEIDYFVKQHVKEISDFSKIPNFSMLDMVQLFWADYHFIINELSKKTDKKTIVMTHHLPTEHSVHEKYKNKKSSHAFFSELSSVIEDYDIRYWLHGHTHDSFDYQIHNTRIICNPRGYKDINQINPTFDWLKKILI